MVLKKYPPYCKCFTARVTEDLSLLFMIALRFLLFVLIQSKAALWWIEVRWWLSLQIGHSWLERIVEKNCVNLLPYTKLYAQVDLIRIQLTNNLRFLDIFYKCILYFNDQLTEPIFCKRLKQHISKMWYN